MMHRVKASARYLCLAILSSCVLCLPANADTDELVDFAKQLNFQSVIAGTFHQERQLQGFSRPLVSSGNFISWRESGLHWETQQPFYRALTYTPKTVLHWSESGQLLNAIELDILQRQVNKIILAMLSADIASLRKLFNISLEKNPQGWKLELLPHSSLVGNIISRVELEGQHHLQSARVKSANGDINTLTFSILSESSTPTVPQCLRFSANPSSLCPAP